MDDASPQVLQEVVTVPSGLAVRFVRQETNMGVAAAAASALGQVSADLVAYLNDDDLWEPAFLERLRLGLTTYPRAVLAFCDHGVIHADGAPDDAYADRMSKQFNRATMSPGLVGDLARVALVNQAVPAASFALTRRTALDPDVLRSGNERWDFFLCLSACLTGDPGVYIDERLGYYRLSPDGITAGWSRPERRVASTAGTITGARLILRSPSLRSIHGEQRRIIARSTLRGLAMTLSQTGSLAAKRRGIAMIARALLR